MKFVFFKRPTYKRFQYKPRYWDPEAEALEKRRRELEGYSGNDRSDEEVREDLKNRMELHWRRRHTSDDAGKSNKWMKIFIYALIIFLGIYFIFFTGFINNLVRFFTE